jgi:hypothetical protein
MAELTGPLTAFAGGTSVVHTTPFPYKVGSRAVDTSGNIYVYCDYTGTIYGGLPVAISSTYTAGPVGITGRGPVGVACGYATSDNGGWVQIYGAATMQIGVAGTSPSDAANGPTTVATSLQIGFTLATSATSLNVFAMTSDASSLSDKYVIRGIIVATDADVAAVSDVTAATSHTGSQVKVFLNFPEIVYNLGGSSG